MNVNLCELENAAGDLASIKLLNHALGGADNVSAELQNCLVAERPNLYGCDKCRRQKSPDVMFPNSS